MVTHRSLSRLIIDPHDKRPTSETNTTKAPWCRYGLLRAPGGDPHHVGAMLWRHKRRPIRDGADLEGAPSLAKQWGRKCAWTWLTVLLRARLRRGGNRALSRPSIHCCLARVWYARVFLRVVCPYDVTNTEFLSPTVVQGQCAPGQTGAVFGGEPPGGVLATAPVVVATPASAMNQLGTVYATKRRRRNGKRYVWRLRCFWSCLK